VVTVVVFAAAVSAAVGSAYSRASSEGTAGVDGRSDGFAALRRPLQLPRLAPGEACPTTEPHYVVGGVAPGLGAGPVYRIGDTTTTFEYPPAKNSGFAGSSWGGEKTLWVAAPRYRGPVLIRGSQLDGPNELRFNHGDGAASRELRLPVNESWAGDTGSSKGWRYFPSYTRLRASGCYAYQLDGTSFSEVIVFKAEAWLPIASPLGAPGCRPPSALAAFGHDLPESPGKVSRASVWALFFPPAGSKVAVSHRAVFANLAGKQMKVVFRVTGSGKPRFVAIAPDGSNNAPVDGPTAHSGSTWERPGEEWGTTFGFAEAGCWRLHVSRRGGTGDVWLVVR
jgi:hypothetical protein